jgi:peptidyl-prolyl cis-trans isomerase A (cyclophilin A)
LNINKKKNGEKNNMEYANFETNLGNFKVELFSDKAPITVGNFMKLVNEGFYDNLMFHRVIPKFMIQGGCPQGNGRGGPGYSIKDEFNPNLKHDSVGMLSMANAGPNTGGSQFFITVAPTPWLDGKHSIFGKVIEGMNVVEEISKVDRDRNDKPLQNIVINKIKILKN